MDALGPPHFSFCVPSPDCRTCHERPRDGVCPMVDSHPQAIPPLSPRGLDDRSGAVLCDMRVLAAGGEATAPGGRGVQERVAGTKLCHPGLHPPGAEIEPVPPRRRWGLQALSRGVDAAWEQVFLGRQQEQLLEGEPGELQPSERPAAGARGPGRAGNGADAGGDVGRGSGLHPRCWRRLEEPRNLGSAPIGCKDGCPNLWASVGDASGDPGFGGEPVLGTASDDTVVTSPFPLVGLPKSSHTETHALLLGRPLPALRGDGLDLAGWLPPGPEPVQPEHPERQRSLRGAEGGQDHLRNLRLCLGVDLPERGRPALSRAEIGRRLGKKKKKKRTKKIHFAFKIKSHPCGLCVLC
ncbi:uncharacterized protein LOC121062598 isoform X1 [Cygnus olor]|uniref:uncharacterized protein LOC121062598 isoform X1 n=1 Tax=Cygnus olor TaxID=8869 RepID=UPI001ADEB06A|nr:uncharacterized protein LOC121062598 isoform X1 [Cygnus olor]